MKSHFMRRTSSLLNSVKEKCTFFQSCWLTRLSVFALTFCNSYFDYNTYSLEAVTSTDEADCKIVVQFPFFPLDSGRSVP